MVRYEENMALERAPAELLDFALEDMDGKYEQGQANERKETPAGEPFPAGPIHNLDGSLTGRPGGFLTGGFSGRIPGWNGPGVSVAVQIQISG